METQLAEAEKVEDDGVRGATPKRKLPILGYPRVWRLAGKGVDKYTFKEDYYKLAVAK